MTHTHLTYQLTFIILAALAAGVYFVYLLSMVVRVFRNIVAKKSSLPSMSKPRRKFYMVITSTIHEIYSFFTDWLSRQGV